MTPLEAESDYERISKLAYKYSTKKRYAESSADDNWFRAKNQLGLLQSSTIPTTEKANSSVSRFSELIGRLLTIVTGVSVGGTIVGAWLLVAYLKRIGAPTPPMDTVFLISISTVVLTLFSALLTIFILPFFVKFLEPSIQKIYPTIFYKAPHQEGREFWSDYFMYHLPLLFLVGSVIAIAFGEKDRIQYLVPASLLVGVFAEGMLLKVWRRYSQLRLTVFQMFPCLGFSVFSSLLSMFSMIVLAVPILDWLSKVTNPGGNSISYWAFGFFSTILLSLNIVLSLFFSNLKDSLRIVLPVIASVGMVALVCFMGPAYLGGEALRFFKSGGGVPVSLTLKSAQLKPESAPVTGCLILLTGSHVLLSSRPLGVGCRLAPSPEWDQVQSRVALVDLYERSDILKIKFVIDEVRGRKK